MNAPHPPPAGWYPDPAGRAPFRWWDGTRWTEHTEQGTAPSPSPTAATPAAPTAPTAPTPPPPPSSPFPAQQPYAPQQPYGTPAPAGWGAATPARPSGTITGQSLVTDLKRFEGLAVIVVGALLVVIASFLPWYSSSGTDPNTGAHVEESANAWEGDGPWLIRGPDVSVENVQRLSAGESIGGTDMVVILPLIIATAGLAVALKLGKPIKNGGEILLGLAVLLAVLLVAEAVSASGSLGDLEDLLAQYGVDASYGLSFGVFLAIACSLAVVAGAGRHLRDQRAARTVR